jgi:hypothetical protein
MTRENAAVAVTVGASLPSFAADPALSRLVYRPRHR